MRTTMGEMEGPKGGEKPTSAPRRATDALTGARFVAAFHVFVFHAWAGRGLPVFLRRIDEVGYIAVSFFFVLSGFVLSSTYGERGKFSLRDFAAARFARIYPLYALCLLVSLPIFLSERRMDDIGSTWIPIAKSFLLVQDWTWPISPSVSFVTWTLSVEAFFYVAFPFLLRLVAGWRPVALGAVFAFVAAGFIAICVLGGARSQLAILRLPEFAMGVILGRLHALKLLDGQSLRRTALFYLSFVGTVATVEIFHDTNLLPGLMPLFFCGVILALAEFDGLPGRILRSRTMVFLGGASYAFYLFHPVVFDILHRLFDRLHRRPDGLLYALIATVATLLLASALFLWVEEPSRKWLRRRLATPRAKIGVEESALASEPL